MTIFLRYFTVFLRSWGGWGGKGVGGEVVRFREMSVVSVWVWVVEEEVEFEGWLAVAVVVAEAEWFSFWSFWEDDDDG